MRSYQEGPASLWGTGSLHASIVLDERRPSYYTNLDIIKGRVVLRCAKSVKIAAVVVKLEGESRTRLANFGPNGEERVDRLEQHKLLYQLQKVFPPPEVVQNSSGRASYTLPPGNHEYGFHFKIPFNNACHADRSMLPTVGLNARGLEIVQPPQRHVKKTLPPNMCALPGQAEIRYFMKVTVERPSILKENPRAFVPFNFLPIESPRPTPNGSQIFARQKHAFERISSSGHKTEKLKSTFGFKSNATDESDGGLAPSVSVDARLPEPAILTCNQPVPLVILVKKLNSSNHIVHLQSLQISLIGITTVTAMELIRNESNSWVIMSKSNMGIPLGSARDPEGTEVSVDDSFWRSLPLPNTVAPSFQTCNISRKYQLDVRIGLSYSGAHANASKPQSIILPLRLDTMVYSGIAPPTEILDRITQARANASQPPSTAVSDKLNSEGQTLTDLPIKQSAQVGPAASAPLQGSRPPPLPQRPYETSSYDDAPPSYEDAIASDIPPVDGYRPDYAPPPPSDNHMLFDDEKKR